MPLDFPANPVNGQRYESYIYDAATASWVGQSSFASLSTRLTSLENSVPAGTIHQSSLSSAPDGYLLCQGQAVSRTTYSSLFSVIGTLYGTGDGSTTFNLPDLQGRVPVGKAASGTFSTLNGKGGSETHTLTVEQMPVHTHTQDPHNHTQDPHNHTSIIIDVTPLKWGTAFAGGSASGTISNNASNQIPFTGSTTAENLPTTATNNPAGSGQAHNNLQPYIVLNYIIKT